MKLMNAIALACSSLAARSRAAFSASSAQSRAAFNRDGIARDIERIEQVRAFLASGDFTVQALRAAVGEHDVIEDRAIGFGGRRIQLALRGTFTTTLVSVFAETDGEDGVSRIARFEALQHGNEDSWEEVSTRLAPAWGEGVERVERGFRMLCKDAARDQALRLRIAEALGGPLDAKPTPELESALATLVDPLVQHVVGFGSGIGGTPPLAIEAMKQLVDAGRFDLVRVVLRGPNPEARAYAAKALINHHQCEKSDAAAIEALSKLSVELHVQFGCLASRVEWNKVVRLVGAN